MKQSDKTLAKPTYLSASVDEWANWDTHERMLRIARCFVDMPVREVPMNSNKGPWVERFQKRAKVGSGNPWCACFAYFCANDAGYEEHELPRHPAAVASWARWAESNGYLVDEPERGDLFYWLGKDGKGHIGFIAQVMPGANVKRKVGLLRTLEGNTDAAGSREGGGCYEKIRSVSTVMGHEKWGFIRLP